MEGEDFASCLRRLMKGGGSHDCHPKHLALGIDYEDRTRVDTWLRGAHIPKIYSDRVDKIVTHLGLSKEQEQELRAALQRSHDTWPRRPPQKKVGPAIKPLIVVPTPQPGGTSGTTSQPQASQAPRAGGRRKGIVEDLLTLLEEAPDGSGRDDDDNTIHLTWQGRDVIEMTDSQRVRWQQGLQSLLRRGWRMRYLCRLDGDIHRTVKLVRAMLNLVGTGAYFPYYFTRYGTMTAPNDVLVIPGFGAAWLFSAYSPHRVDAGFVTHDARQVREIAAYARQLSEQTTALIKPYFSTENNYEYLKALRDAEAKNGSRYVLANGLSVPTQPLRCYTSPEAPPFPIHPNMDWAKTSENRAARIRSFHDHLKTYECWDISAEAAIEQLMSGYSLSRSGPWSATAEARAYALEHLKNLVSLLREAPRNYHLALVSDRQRLDDGQAGVPMDMSWEVTGGKSVFLETWASDGAGQRSRLMLHITEPHVADGFREYFQQMWEQIPLSNNDDVIHWLEDKIALLEHDLGHLTRPQERRRRPRRPRRPHVTG